MFVKVRPEEVKDKGVGSTTSGIMILIIVSLDFIYRFLSKEKMVWKIHMIKS